MRVSQGRQVTASGRNRIEGIAWLFIVLGLVGCTPPVTGEKTGIAPTPFPSVTFVPPEITPDRNEPSPTPEVLPGAPVLKYNAWEIVHDLAYSPDGRLLAVSAGEQVHLYDSATLVEQHGLPVGGWANRLVFHPDHPWIILAVRDGSIQFWDIARGTLLCRFMAHEKGANSVSIHPSGAILATTGVDRVSRLWDISSIGDGKCSVAESGRLIGESYSAPDVAFSSDGRWLALVDLTSVRLRNSVDLKLLATLTGNLPIFDLAFSPDTHWLAVAEHHDTVTLWDLTQPVSPRPHILSPGKADPGSYIWRVAFSPASNLLATGGSDGVLTLWDLTSLQAVKTFLLPRAVTALSFSPDGKVVAAGGLDASVWLFSTP